MSVSTYVLLAPRGWPSLCPAGGLYACPFCPQPPHALEEGRQEDGVRSPLPSQPPAPRRPAPPHGLRSGLVLLRR